MTRGRAHRWARVAALLCVAALFPVACGRGEDRAAPTTAPAAPTSTGRSSPPPASTVRPLVTLALAGDVHFMKVPGARLARNPETAFRPVAAVLRRADVAPNFRGAQVVSHCHLGPAWHRRSRAVHRFNG
jgi:hypothetical protein